VKIAAVCDIQPDRVRKAAETYEAKPYDDYKQMLKAESLDACYVCVIPGAHANIELDLVKAKVPFYEKVNRFVFGPPRPKEDAHAAQARILVEIRARRGRITLGDVMRVSGLPRDRADPLMARLMLDHDGEVEVGEGGGIVYRFEALRRTALEPTPAEGARPAAAWERLPAALPLTGNSAGSNVVVALLNDHVLLAGELHPSGNVRIGGLWRLRGAERRVDHRLYTVRCDAHASQRIAEGFRKARRRSYRDGHAYHYENNDDETSARGRDHGPPALSPPSLPATHF
jgi:hypothetical protein